MNARFYFQTSQKRGLHKKNALSVPPHTRILDNMAIAPDCCSQRNSTASDIHLVTINEAGLPLFAERRKDQKDQQEVRLTLLAQPVSRLEMSVFFAYTGNAPDVDATLGTGGNAQGAIWGKFQFIQNKLKGRKRFDGSEALSSLKSLYRFLSVYLWYRSNY